MKHAERMLVCQRTMAQMMLSRGSLTIWGEWKRIEMEKREASEAPAETQRKTHPDGWSKAL